MEYKIPEHLQHFIISISLEPNNKLIRVKFGIVNDNKEIVSPFDIKDIPNSIEKLEQKIKKTIGISTEEYNEIENIILSELSENTEIGFQQVPDKKTKKNEVTVNKYSQNRKGDLYESIILGGEPTFLSYNSLEGPTTQPFIEEKTRILLPPSEDEYLHEPYEFDSVEEIQDYISRARKETRFTLFKKGKSIILKYIDQEKHIIDLLSIDLIFSYFQDRFNTVHYIGIFGDNGTGKSSIGDLAEALYYRAFNTTDPTAPNIFRSLGNVEPGQITLILDEAEKVDQSHDMIGILKSGYSYNKRVSRINPNTGKPELFLAYCKKIIIAERPPNPNIAKGVNDRILGDVVYFGCPKYDIKEILNPSDTGGEEFKILLKEIVDFRKLLFIYRLLHFHDHIKNIKVSVSGRNKELIKPYLQLFSDFSTKEEEEIYQQIQSTFETLLRIKNDKKDSSLEVVLLPILIELEVESKTRKVTFSEFWEEMKRTIKGKQNEYKPNKYNTEDYGTIYRNSITFTLKKLGVSTKGRNSYTELIFDHKKLLKAASQYNIKIQTTLSEENDGESSESSERSLGPYGENNLTDEGKHDDNETKSEMDVTENSESSIRNDIKSHNVSNTAPILEESSSIERSQRSQRSPNEQPDFKVLNSIYRIGKTDVWGCNNCKMRDDKWFMQEHPCRGLKSY